MGERRGFVAAPLVGTILFLIALVFVVNLTKIDNGEVAKISSEAFHARLASLVEIYRTDVSGVFRTGVTRAAQEYLSGQCWASGPFSLRFPDSGDPGRSDSEYNERLTKCQDFTRHLQSQVCSRNPNYGLKKWLATLNESITFEGLRLDISNKRAFDAFLNELDQTVDCRAVEDNLCGGATRNACCDQATGACCQQRATTCDVLVSAVLFDCQSFARRAPDAPNPDPNAPLQCVDADGGVVPGCEDGTFYIAMDVENPLIFPLVPRVLAQDGTGNEIRSGALSDGNFLLHINYPLFRYYDEAYKLHRRIAYGSNENPQACDAGVWEGFCWAEGAGGGGCNAASSPYQTQSGGTACQGLGAAGGSQDLASEGASYFYSNVFSPALDKLRVGADGKPTGLDVKIEGLENHRPEDYVDVLRSRLLTTPVDVPRGDGGSDRVGVAYYDHSTGLRLTLRLTDDSPVYRVKHDAPNSFCFATTTRLRTA